MGGALKLQGQPQSQLQAPIMLPFRLQDVPCCVAMSFSPSLIVDIDSNQVDPTDYFPIRVSGPRIELTLETPAPFGNPIYSRQELVAEFGAAFLCAQAGIDNSAATSTVGPNPYVVTNDW